MQLVVAELGSEPGLSDPKAYILDHSPLSFRGRRGSRVEGQREDKITKRNRQAHYWRIRHPRQ